MLSSHSIQQQWTISQSDYEMQQKVDFIQPETTSSVAGPKMKLWSTSQSQTCMKNRSWSLFGGLLPVWSTTVFWILAKSSHLRSMLSKLMRYTKNCNVCSWHCSTEQAQFSSTTSPVHSLHNQHFKSWTNWVTDFCLICHVHLTSHQPTTFKHLNNFLQGRCFHNQEYTENAFQEFVEFERANFYATGINLFPIGKNVLTVMVPILLIKMCFSLIILI